MTKRLPKWRFPPQMRVGESVVVPLLGDWGGGDFPFFSKKSQYLPFQSFNKPGQNGPKTICFNDFFFTNEEMAQS